jgi:catechol 2,3-dioxygenase-like lactoylglutathione lyase family enzyme
MGKARPQSEMCRVGAFSLTTANVAGLAHFYESAFGFRRLSEQRHSGTDFQRLMEVKGGAHGITLGLGGEKLELLEFDDPGRPYPRGSISTDLIFQHFALVAPDIADAYQRLLAVKGWMAISKEGPERLPDSSGGVTAFKFRDPEGHPLELIAFAPATTPQRWQRAANRQGLLGINHSALSILETHRSVGFYENLGLRTTGRTRNSGLEQDRLDGIPGIEVDVTALRPADDGAHIELLCYHTLSRRQHLMLRNNDIAATRIALDLGNDPDRDTGRPGVSRHVLDPDGHHLILIETQPASAWL